jgi:lipopolysaccharide transport system ATP-binding protein
MSDIVIEVENLAKQYRLGQVGRRTLSHDINRWWHQVRGKEDPYVKIGQENDRTTKGGSEYVWALQDIDFQVKEGEVLGIIGRNGAGKSTLLKILSKVTSPTKGQVKIRGRIASLLEVGTGFHQDLSGRDNIFLNGAILGMTKKEIASKFDEIVDFAGVELYIDTPVKRYSSGMYVRLAFAVAAHLEPEILIIDEVLAVGDAEFQKKCLGKMRDVSEQEGRTVLFVSHNMQAITTLTENCLLLNYGKVLSHGKSSNVVHQYYQLNDSALHQLYYENNIEAVNKPIISKIEIMTTYNKNVQAFGEVLKVKFTINNPIAIKDAAISYQIYNEKEEPLIHILNLNSEKSFCKEKGLYELTSVIPKLRLYPGNYYLKAHFADNSTKTKFETIDKICMFEVQVFDVLRDYYWGKNSAIYSEDSYWTVSVRGNKFVK